MQEVLDVMPGNALNFGDALTGHHTKLHAIMVQLVWLTLAPPAVHLPYENNTLSHCKSTYLPRGSNIYSNLYHDKLQVCCLSILYTHHLSCCSQSPISLHGVVLVLYLYSVHARPDAAAMICMPLSNFFSQEHLTPIYAPCTSPQPAE